MMTGRTNEGWEKTCDGAMFVKFCHTCYSPHVGPCEVPSEISASLQGLFCLKSVVSLSPSNSKLMTRNILWLGHYSDTKAFHSGEVKYLTMGVLQ